MEFVIAGQGTPPVVFENGLGGTLDWWAKVAPEAAKFDTVFAYNRPGYGHSDRASTPRDGDHIVDELRNVLHEEHIAPPYVLVGHSLGGLYLQLFARRYPLEVAALVLVDPTHPQQFSGAGAPENWPAPFRLLFKLATSDVAKQEFDAVPATGQAMLALPPFEGKPVIILSALEPMQANSDLARDANVKRQDIARLHPGSRQVWVDSGHGIPLEKPDSVIAAIRDALQQSRAASAARDPRTTGRPDHKAEPNLPSNDYPTATE